jgi:hypothetical protein
MKGSRNNSVVGLFDISVKWRVVEITTELFLLPFTWLKHQTYLQLNYFYYPSLDWNIKQTYNWIISTTLHLTDISNKPTTELFLLPFTWLKHQTDLWLNYFYYPSLDWYIKQTYNWIISTTLHLTEISNRPTTELFLLPFTWLKHQTGLIFQSNEG